MSIGSDHSSSKQSSNQSVWGTQSPYLKDLFSQAKGQLPEQAPYTQEAQKTYWDSAYDQKQNYQNAQDAFNSGLGADSPYNQLGEQASSTLQGMMTQDPVNNPYLQGNVQSAMDQITQNLQRNILPSVGTDAQMAGQFGSSRHGIAQGLALSDANKQASDLAQSMYGQAYDQGMQNRLNATGQAQGMLGQGTQTGLAQQQGYSNLANLGMLPGQSYEQAGQVGFNPLDRYANILGGPTVLTSSSGRESSGGWNFGI